MEKKILKIKKNGFTLTKVLLVMGISVLIMGLVFVVYQIGSERWNDGKLARQHQNYQF